MRHEHEPLDIDWQRRVASGAVAVGTGRHDLRATLLRGRGLLGVLLVAAVVVLGVVGPLLTPYSPTQQIAGANLVGPSAAHWLGTDDVNRDILARTLYGHPGRPAWWCSSPCPLGALLGGLVGLVSSTFAVADVVTQRVFDLVLAFPTLILAIALTAFIGPGVLTVAVVIVVAEIPVFGRMVRTAVAGGPRDAVRRVLPRDRGGSRLGAAHATCCPNSLEPVIVQLALSMSVAVFIEGAMSFLGIGVRPPHPSLGSLIKDGTRNIYDEPVLRRRTAGRRGRARPRLPPRRPGAVPRPGDLTVRRRISGETR